jgi:hypothetical protein
MEVKSIRECGCGGRASKWNEPVVIWSSRMWQDSESLIEMREGEQHKLMYLPPKVGRYAYGIPITTEHVLVGKWFSCLFLPVKLLTGTTKTDASFAGFSAPGHRFLMLHAKLGFRNRQHLTTRPAVAYQCLLQWVIDCRSIPNLARWVYTYPGALAYLLSSCQLSNSADCCRA